MSPLTNRHDPHPYTPSFATDIRKTINRARKELGQAKPRPRRVKIPRLLGKPVLAQGVRDE